MILMIGSYGAGITARLPRIPEAGETISQSSVSIGHGGKSSNQAVAAARQGGEVALLTAIGDDAFGASARQLWEVEGVSARIAATGSGETMAGVILVEPDGENRIAIAPGVLDEFRPELLDDHADAFAAADYAVLCLEIPVPTVERAIELARQQGARTILNTAPAARISHEVLARVDYLVLNETEAAYYERDGYAPPASQTIVKTLGASGVEVRPGSEVGGAGEIWIVPPQQQQRVVDTTGAGDTFVGTLAAALDAGEELRAAVERAVVASSLSVTVSEVIPSIPSRRTVDAHLETYRTANGWLG